MTLKQLLRAEWLSKDAAAAALMEHAISRIGILSIESMYFWSRYAGSPASRLNCRT
jgi:hypothetical protein